MSKIYLNDQFTNDFFDAMKDHSNNLENLEFLSSVLFFSDENLCHMIKINKDDLSKLDSVLDNFSELKAHIKEKISS